MAHLEPVLTPNVLQGTLHIFVAFDWGDEIQLDRVRQLVPALQHELPRRRRNPPSFLYRPAPLHVPLGQHALELAEIGVAEATAGVTLFDFAAVSVGFRVPFALDPASLSRLAGTLADSTYFVKKAREILAPLHAHLLPLIQDPLWQDELSEEYFVFQLDSDALPQTTDAAWLAGLVHLESGPLSKEEIDEALRSQISYSPQDLFVPDWAAAVLIDRDCDDTLHAVEFANLQLLEFRHIDNRLDESLAAAARTLQPLSRSRWANLRVWNHPLRVIGELKVEANGLFERTGNALKLVGDPYLARVYRLIAKRFYLEAWMESIQRKLEVAEGIYEVVTDQANHFRSQFLEVVVVLLILIEIIMGIFHR